MMRLAAIFFFTGMASAACLPITEAPAKIGQTACITGKVVKVGVGNSGTLFLNFCEDYRQCPFTVVVFPGDLRHVGDVRQLEGKTVEVHGKVQKYGGQAEIILRESRQLRGEAAKLPPLPKTYDVERKGGFSAGKFSRPASKPR
jgi:hypothetical protein